MLVKPLCMALLLALPCAARAEILTFAAASLGGPLDRVVEAWEAQGGAEVTVSYAGSSALARQIAAVRAGCCRPMSAMPTRSALPITSLPSMPGGTAIT